jgi:hypothetical protein
MSVSNQKINGKVRIQIMVRYYNLIALKTKFIYSHRPVDHVLSPIPRCSCKHTWRNNASSAQLLAPFFLLAP